MVILILLSKTSELGLIDHLFLFIVIVISVEWGIEFSMTTFKFLILFVYLPFPPTRVANFLLNLFFLLLFVGFLLHLLDLILCIEPLLLFLILMHSHLLLFFLRLIKFTFIYKILHDALLFEIASLWISNLVRFE